MAGKSPAMTRRMWPRNRGGRSMQEVFRPVDNFVAIADLLRGFNGA